MFCFLVLLLILLFGMMNKKNGWIVYHYEETNDGRQMLLFEPNIFHDINQVHIHCDALQYLSGRQFYYCQENDISQLDLILDSLPDFGFINKSPHLYFED